MHREDVYVVSQQVPNRRGLKVPLDTERLRVLTKVFADYGGAVTQQALTIRAHLLLVDDTDPKQVEFLKTLYRRAVNGEDVLRENPNLRLFPIDVKPI